MENNKTKQFTVTARKKESARRKLAVTAKEKESARLKLAVTAKEKESVRSKLATVAKQLAVTAKEAESVRRKLAVTAKEKEGVRNKLVITAKKLATTAKEAESVRRKLAVTAKEKESIRSKLAMVARQLATTAKEREDARRSLVVTAKNLKIKAKQLAKTAEEKEYVRGKLEVTAKQLATTAEEKEEVRSRLAVVAKKLAATAKEKENVRQKLAVIAKQLKDKAIQLAVTAKEMELANKELRSLDLAKDEFVSIASHQLRTPLTALKGYAGMLLDGDAGPINDKQREYLVEMKNANDRMIGLITALLNVSRVDLGVFIVEPERLSLKKVAEDALKDLGMKIEGKKLQVEMNFENNIPLINADLNIVRMIFQNLFTNAVKYTPAGGKININIKKDGPNVLISVADTGYGIPSNVQPKIFTKMFRADNARIKDPDGTGLGLYIIKSTLEKTGGKVWFESVENKGSTFYVTLPLEGMKKKEGTKRLELK